ncbi:MAG: hypothetical protein WA148_05570 [Actinomycetota bacterium]
MAKMMCVHDIKGINQNQINELIEKSKSSNDPRLNQVLYNTDKGEAFFEWDASSADKVMAHHQSLGLGACREMLPVTAVEVKRGY